jgi:PAS domain S-box-containing protein
MHMFDPPPNDRTNPRPFLAGDGEMARLMRAKAWCDTPLGPIAQWSQALRTVIRLLLTTRHPMYMFWGPHLACLWNDAFTVSLGPERHPGSLGQPAREVWAEIWDTIGPQIEHVMTGRGSTWNTNQHVPITRNGRREDAYWTYGYSPIDDDTAPGGIGGVLVIINETTDLVLAEQRNAERAATRTAERDRLAALFAAAPSFMCLLSVPDYRIELINEAYSTLVGRRDIVGKTVAEALPETVAQGYLTLLDTVYRTGQPHSGKAAGFYIRVSPDAPIIRRYINFVCQPVRNAGGQVTGIFIEGSDVTDSVLAEKELRQTVRLLRTIIETAPGVIYAKDREGRMLIANSAALDLVGRPADYVLGRTDDEFLDDPAQSGAIMQNDRLVMATGQTHQLEESVGAQDGAPRLFLSTKTPLRDEDGTVAGIVGVSVDITNRKRMEQQLQTLNASLEAQVSERTAALAQAAEALRQSQKMEALGQLTGGIAHDFNNMLQGVTSGVTLAKRRIEMNRAAEAMKFLDAAAEAAGRAAALTARLLAFGRRQALDPRPIQLDELVNGLLDLIQRTVGPAIEVELRVLARGWPVLCDPNQLENALLNLVINARDAMAPNHGRLIIETAHLLLSDADTAAWEGANPGEYVRMTVTDTGTGMTPDVLAHAFEPFFTTKPDGQGTGLGLSQLYGFVRQSHGGVRLESTLGKGTSVHLYLPRCHDTPDASRAPAATGAMPAPARRAPRLLLVDDEPVIRTFAAESLRELGYEVLEAGDGPQALRLLNTASGRLDLLVADVGLPGGLNGRQLADAAREMLPALPILLITGYAGDAIVGQGRLATGMEILGKPFDLDELGRRVRAMVENA